MALGLLLCKRCGRALAKVRSEHAPIGPRRAPRRCRGCLVEVRLDPSVPLGVRP